MKKVLLTLSLLSASALVPSASAQTAATTNSAAATTQATPAQSAPAQAAPTQTPAAQTSATQTPAAHTPATQTTAAPAVAPKTAPVTPAPVVPAPRAAPAAANDSAVVAQVGSEKITLGEFNRDFRVAAAHIVNQQGIPFDEGVLAEFAPARPDYLKQYVRQRALYQLALASVKPNKATTDAQFAKARAGFKTDAEFAKALAATGYNTPDMLRLTLERQDVINRYLDSVQKKFKVSDANVSSYYALHRATFTAPAQACVKHILVPSKAEADAVVKSLSSGGNFVKLAESKSQDPGSAAKGGDLGCVSTGQTVPAFDKASFNGPLGKPQVVQSEFGWHVLIVSRRIPAGVKPLKDVSAQIREQLSREAAQKYLDAQISRVSVKTFPEVVTVAVPAPVAAPATAPAAAPAAPAAPAPSAPASAAPANTPAAIPATPIPATPATK